MARHKDETEKIVPDVLVERRFQVHTFLSTLRSTSDLQMLALDRLTAADQVDRTMLGSPHEPGTRFLRHTRGRPLLERGDEGILGELLSCCHVADDASKAGDEPG